MGEKIEYKVNYFGDYFTVTGGGKRVQPGDVVTVGKSKTPWTVDAAFEFGTARLHRQTAGKVTYREFPIADLTVVEQFMTDEELAKAAERKAAAEAPVEVPEADGDRPSGARGRIEAVAESLGYEAKRGTYEGAESVSYLLGGREVWVRYSKTGAVSEASFRPANGEAHEPIATGRDRALAVIQYLDGRDGGTLPSVRTEEAPAPVDHALAIAVLARKAVTLRTAAKTAEQRAELGATAPYKATLLRQEARQCRRDADELDATIAALRALAAR